MTVATETATLKNYSQSQSLLISWFSGQANSGQQLRQNRTALCDVMYCIYIIYIYIYTYSYIQLYTVVLPCFPILVMSCLVTLKPPRTLAVVANHCTLDLVTRRRGFQRRRSGSTAAPGEWPGVARNGPVHEAPIPLRGQRVSG